MSDWTAGYVADIGYTFGYYTELNPLRLKLAFLHAGLAYPETSTACELGFGQGLSVNIHAAATSSSWSGTDFNPAQAGFALDLARASGAQTRLYDESFAEFCQRADLPDFDYIGLHGIWSWISDENRRLIVDFIHSKLKVGGVLYISYNTLPGWSAFAPMRHLMNHQADVLGVQGHGIVNRINSAIEFCNQLIETNPNYLTANPQVADRIKKLGEQNRSYLAHEYFNRDWHPMYFADMVEWLAPAKVNYACSAHFLDFVDLINLTAEQQALLKDIPDPLFVESVRDFMVDQQFRRDYWVKGTRKLSPLAKAEGLRAQRLILVHPRSDVSLKVRGAQAEATLSPAVYNPVLDLLADHKPRTLGQIELAIKESDVSFTQLIQAVMILIGVGQLLPAQDEQAVTRAKKYSDKLNAKIIDLARGGNEVNYLASPVTGGGHQVMRFQQLFLLARSQGLKQPQEWARFVWQLLAGQNQQIVKEGRQLESEEENVAELTTQAITFAEKLLPILKALQIA